MLTGDYVPEEVAVFQNMDKKTMKEYLKHGIETTPSSFLSLGARAARFISLDAAPQRVEQVAMIDHFSINPGKSYLTDEKMRFRPRNRREPERLLSRVAKNLRTGDASTSDSSSSTSSSSDSDSSDGSTHRKSHQRGKKSREKEREKERERERIREKERRKKAKKAEEKKYAKLEKELRRREDEERELMKKQKKKKSSRKQTSSDESESNRECYSRQSNKPVPLPRIPRVTSKTASLHEASSSMAPTTSRMLGPSAINLSELLDDLP